MTDDEVAGLFPEPGEPVVPSAHEVRTGIPVGRTAGGSIVSIATPTLEGRHLLVLGETGMGKSSTLAAFVLAAARHHGVVLFDPLGETARTIAARAPARVRSRLLLSFPTEHPMELNALAGSVGLPRDSDALERRLLDLVAGLRRVRSFRYPETSFWGPRIEEVLRRALGVVAARPGATLIDARQILDRPSGRGDAAIRGGTDEEDDLLRLARSRPEEVDGARRLLAEITDSPTLRRLLCATEPTSDADALVAPGCVALLSGDAGAVGETVARYLLAVQLSLVWGRLVARPPGRKVFVVLDEAQWYAHEAVAEMLRLARRSNVHLVVATQALGALSPALQEALLANCADYLLFRGSPDDARTFGRWRPDLPSEAFLGLDRGEAWLLRGKGHDAERIRTAQPGPSVEPPRESEPEVGTRHGSSPSESPPDAVAEHLERLCRASRDPEVHVPLAPLREGDAPAGASMRRWGRALAAAGALRASLGSGADRYWVLDRERTLDLLATPRRTAPTAEGGEPRAPYRPNV